MLAPLPGFGAVGESKTDHHNQQQCSCSSLHKYVPPHPSFAWHTYLSRRSKEQSVNRRCSMAVCESGIMTHANAGRRREVRDYTAARLGELDLLSRSLIRRSVFSAVAAALLAAA